MPSKVEQSYIEQGYRLPHGLTWQDVERIRSKWSIDPTFVPLTVSPGCIGWGVPFVDGKP